MKSKHSSPPTNRREEKKSAALLQKHSKRNRYIVDADTLSKLNSQTKSDEIRSQKTSKKKKGVRKETYPPPPFPNLKTKYVNPLFSHISSSLSTTCSAHLHQQELLFFTRQNDVGETKQEKKMENDIQYRKMGKGKKGGPEERKEIEIAD
ncbi:hypothetical protein CEXT_559851 [Caerostris extrusa]|uniref:Uncharacterized protein n=1 Tax=Caerostris extrusa TaxID=172846 RepID=A0AAV4NSM8_CAEEX|nr:hypothetical protein CEXT_559851 [Caerostris extrusa]